jgi:hypothetical protein
MRRVSTIYAIALLTIGCANSGALWSHPTKSASRWDADMMSCSIYADSRAGWGDVFGFVWTDHYERCMGSLGWKKEEERE